MLETIRVAYHLWRAGKASDYFDEKYHAEQVLEIIGNMRRRGKDTSFLEKRAEEANMILTCDCE